MIVRIVKDWKNPDLMRQTPGGAGIWDGIKFTQDRLDECDVVIVLNRPPENIVVQVRKGGAWLFSQESPIDIYEWHKKSFHHFDYAFTFWDERKFGNAIVIEDQTSLPWHVNKTYDELKALRPASDKRNELSWVTSNATGKQGHKLRMAFLAYLQNKNFPLHLYGRGFEPIEDKFDGIAPFKYSLAIENYSCRDYWTEKLADCYLSWTLPVYYGCNNILKYFPESSMIRIDPSKPEAAMEKITEAMKEDQWNKRLSAIEEARELVLEKYQFFPAVAARIKQLAPTPEKCLKVIPANDFGKIAQLPFGIRMKSKFNTFLGR